MADVFQNSARLMNPEAVSISSGKKVSKGSLVASRPKFVPQAICKHVASLKNCKIGDGTASDVAVFLLKVAALEAVRRISKAKCPFVWNALQALQCLCYPPLKWIQRWVPLQGLINELQKLSRPTLVLSIVAAFSNESERTNEISDNTTPSQSRSVEPPSSQNPTDTRTGESSPPSLSSEDWLIRLHKELENEEISLPERINEDELRRFYAITNGDFTCFLSSIKKTIRWRDTYRILTEEELEPWSNFVFWHGYDVQHRPCLIVRLGFACLKLPSKERPRFGQAIVSQVEHGILRLLDPENPKITVLVDCEGLSPLRIPMQVVRSCSSILQDHYPNRLSCLFVIRLPPVVRVIAQTFIQVLRPNTRKKLRIEGEMFRRVLLEYLETLPAYLGGDCKCMRCSKISNYEIQQMHPNRSNRKERNIEFSGSDDIRASDLAFDDDVVSELRCDQVLRTAIISALMLWLLVVLIAGIHDPDGRPF